MAGHFQASRSMGPGKRGRLQLLGCIVAGVGSGASISAEDGAFASPATGLQNDMAIGGWTTDVVCRSVKRHRSRYADRGCCGRYRHSLDLCCGKLRHRARRPMEKASSWGLNIGRNRDGSGSSMAKPDKPTDTSAEWAKHLRPQGKRHFNKKVRRKSKAGLSPAHRSE